MTRLAALRRTRAELLGKTALHGALTGVLSLIATCPALAAQLAGLPVQASTTPQVAGGAAGQPTISVSGAGGSNPATMVVQTNASRTLIDWNSFTVAQGNAVNFTFNTRSDIVLNRLVNSTPVVIDGTINATIGSVTGPVGGNVWFSAPGGVIFGSTAVVNVGGLLATTALVDTTSFLNANNTSSFPFTYPGTGYPGTTGYASGAYPGGSTYPAGSAFAAITAPPTSNVAGGVGGVTVQAGASLTTQGGLLALIAPFVNVAAGATVQSTDQTASGGGAGSVLYGSANAFTVSLSQESSGDLDMLQFVIDSPSQVTDNPLVLQGTTAGTNVYVASLTASGITGAVVDATGTLTATTASTGQGGEIILSTGSDTVNAPGFASGTFTPGSISNQQGVAFSSSDLLLGSMTAGQDIQAASSGALNGGNSTGYAVMAGGDATLSAEGDLTLNDVTSSSGQIALSGGTVTAGALNSGAYAQIDTVTDVNPSGGVSLGSVTAGGGINITASGGTVGVASTLTANGGSVVINAGGDVTLGDAVSSVDDVEVSTLNNNGSALGAITTSAITAQGVISLQGASVFATALTANGFTEGPSIYVSATSTTTEDAGHTVSGAKPADGANGGFVDIGSATANGDITLSANGGYASLSSVDFLSSGQTLSITSSGGLGLYFGYGQGGPQANGSTGATGGVTGTGTIDLSSDGDVNVDVNTGLALDSVTAAGAVNLTAASDLSLANDLSTGGDINVTSPGQITLADVTSTGGSVTLNGGTGVSFGTGSAAENFIATAITGAPGTGDGVSSGPGTGTGQILASGDVTATNGYIDLEGTDVEVSNLSASGANGANGDYIYAAAWGPSGGSSGTLSYSSLSPAYTFSSTPVFLYPMPSAEQPPAQVTLPVQDTSSPAQYDGGGAAPTIGAPGGLGDGNIGETVTLNAKRTLIDWTSYTIGSGGEVDYVFNPVEGQSAANARGNIVLNRITGGGPVDIEGVLTSTVNGDTQAYGGNVWFSAPGGVVFGSGAVVNVGGLLATTAGFSAANLTDQFLDPTVFTFNLDGAGSGYPSGATGFPNGTGYPGGVGYPVDGSAIGVTVEGGAQINGSGSLVALVAPFVQVQSGAQVTDLDANGNGAASVLYAGVSSSVLTVSQPSLGGDAVNGQGDLDFGSLAIGTNDLSGYATPLDIEGVTSALNVYVAALSPSQISGATAIVTGPINAVTSAAGTGGEIILSTGADTITAGQVPVLTGASISPLELSLDTVTAGGPLSVLSSGGINASTDPNGVLNAGGDLTLNAGGDISVAELVSGGDTTVTATTSNGNGGLYGVGAISVTNSAFAGGSIDLEGSSVTATTLTAGFFGGPGGITASAYDTANFSNAGGASVDIGSATATGDITLIANDGYASLTNVTFSGSGQTLTMNGGGDEVLYLGYGPGGPTANQDAGPAGDLGAIGGVGAGSASINLFAFGDVDVSLVGAATLTSVTANSGSANLTADSLTITGVASGDFGLTAAARTGDLNAQELDSAFGDVNATATAGSVFLANTTANNVYVTAAQTAHVDNATTVSEDDDPIDVTGATAYLGIANSQDDINVTATNGSATAGDLTAFGSITVTATNGVASIHSATLLQGSGYPNTLSVTATGTTADVLIGDPVGTTATGFVTGATSITATADEDVAVNVDQAIELNQVSAGRNANLTAPSLTLDSLQGTLTGDVAIDVTAGAFTYTSPITAGGGVNLAASGALTLGDLTGKAGAVSLTGAGVTGGAVSAGGALSLTSTGGDITLSGAASGQTVTAAATTPDGNGGAFGTGAISLGDVTATQGIDLEGSSVSAGALTDGASILVRADTDAVGDPTAGIAVTSATAPEISLIATGTAISPGSGATYTTGVGPITAGSLVAGDTLTVAGLSVVATSVSAGSTATVTAYANPNDTSAPSQIDLGGLTAGGAATLNAGNGYASITNLTLTGAATLDVTASGAVYLGYASGGTGMGAGSGSITNPNGGAINLTGGGDVDVDVPGSVALGDIDATSTVANLTADSLSVASVTASQGINLTANTGDLTVGVATLVYGTALNATATDGNATVGQAYAANINVTAGQLAELDGGETNRFSGDDTVRVVKVIGASVVVGGVDSQNDIIAMASNGSATVGDVSAGGDVTVSAVNGSASLHSVGPSPSSSNPGVGAVSVTASGTGADVTLGGTNQNGTGFVTGAGSITLQADQDVTVDVSQPIELTSVQAGHTVSLTAPSLTLDSLSGALSGDIDIDVTGDSFSDANTLTAGGAVNVTAAGALSLGEIDAQAGGVSLNGASVSTGELTAAGGLSVAALAGDADLGSANAGSFVNVAASGSVVTGALTAGVFTQGTGSIDLRAGLETAQSPTPNLAGEINTGALTAGDYISIISAPGGVTVASAQTSPGYQTEGWIHILGYSTGPVEAPYATTGQYTPPDPAFITIGAINAGSGVSLTTSSALSLTGNVTSGGHVALLGASVTGENLNAGPITSDGTGLVVAASNGAVSLGDATSQGGALTLSGSSVNAGALNASGDIAVNANAGAISLASATSGGGVSLGAPAGAITLASTLQANGGDAMLFGGGDVSLGGAVSASGNVVVSTQTTTGASALGALSATSITAGGGIDLEATSIQADTLQAQTSYGASGYAVTAHAYDASDGSNAGQASVQIGSVVSPGDVRLISDDGAINVNTINAGDILLVGSAGGVTASGALTASGDVYAGTQSGGSALGAISLGNVSAGGGIDLEGTSVQAQTLSAQGVDGSGFSITAHAYETSDASNAGESIVNISSATGPAGVRIFADDGAIQVGSLTAGTTLDLEGSSVQAGSLTAGGADATGASITANANARSDGSNAGAAFVDVGSVSAPGDIALTASDGYASLTNVTFTGSGQTLSLTSQGGSPVYVGYGQGGPAANNGAGPTAAVGRIVGTGALILASAGDVDLDVAAGSGLVTVGSVNAGGAANLTADALTLPGVVQGVAGVTATARTGDLNANALDSSAGDVTAVATAGSVFLATTTADDVYVTAAQTAHVDHAVSLATLADPINVTGAIAYLGTASSADDINVIAINGSATAGDLTALGSIIVSAANGSASLHSATLSSGTSFPNTVSVSATGSGADVLIGDPVGTTATGFVTGATSITATADEDVNVNVDQAIALNQVSAGRNVSLTAPGLTLGALQGALTGDLAIDVTASGFTYTSPLTVGGAINLAASSALTLGGLTANGGDITLDGASVSAGNLAAAGAVSVAALNGDATLGSATAGTFVSVDTRGSIATGDLTAGVFTAGTGFIDLRAGLENAQTLSPNASGAVTTGALLAGDYINIGSAPGGVTVASAQTSASYETQGWVHITGYQTGPVENPNPAAGAYTAPDPAFITVGAIVAGSGVSLSTGGALDLTGDVTSGGHITLLGASVTGAKLSAGPITSDGTGLLVSASNGAVSLGDVSSQGGTLTLSGSSVSAGALNASGTVDVTAPGALSLGGVTGAQILLMGDGVVTGALNATLGTQITSGADVATGAVQSGSIVLVTAAGAVTTGDVTASSRVAIDGGGAVSVGDVTESGSDAIQLTGGAVSAGALSGQGSISVAANGLVDANGATAPGSGTLSIASATAGGDLTLTAQAAVLASGVLRATSGDLSVTSGGDIALEGPASAGGSVSVNATSLDPTTGVLTGSGAITAGAITAGGAIALEGTSVFATSLTALGSDATGASVTATAYAPVNGGSGFVDIGSISAPAGVSLSAGDGYASLTRATFTQPGGSLSISTLADGAPIYLGYAQGGQLAGGGTGSITGAPTVELSAGGAVNADLAGAAAFNQVIAGGAISLTADALSSNLVLSEGGVAGNGGDGSITAVTRSGDLSLADVESQGGPINLTSAAAATVGFVASPGGVTITAAGAADVGYASEILYFANPSTGAALEVGINLQPIRITGAQVSLGLADSYGGDVITATNGDADVGDLHFGGGAIVIQAANGTASLHSASLLGSATDVAPPNLATTTQAFAYETPAASSVTVSATGTNADVSIGGPAQTAYIETGVGGSHLIGGTGIGFITGASSVTLQAARDVTVDLSQAAVLTSIQAGRNVSLTAPSLTLDSLTGGSSGDIDIDLTTGGFTDTGALTAGGSLTIAAAGPVTLGAVTAAGGDLNVSSQGAASVGDATASGDITLTANAGSASLHSATLTGSAGVLSISASGAGSDISLGQGTGFVQGAAQTDLQAGRDVTVAVDGAISLTSVQAGRNVSVTGADIQAASLTSGQDTSLISTGQVTVSDVNAAEDLSIDAAGAISLGVSDVGRNLVLTGASVSLAGLTSSLGGDVMIDATNGGFTTPTGAPITAAGPIDISASGALGAGALQSGGAVSLSGASVTTGAISAAGAVNVAALSGALSIASIATASSATLSGLGISLSTGRFGGDLTLASGAGATLGVVTVGGDLALDAVGLASLGSVSVAGAGRVTAGDLDIATLLSAPNLTIEALNGGLTVGGTSAPTDGSLWLSEAEFSRIVAPTSLALYAGSTTATARGALVISDLSLDPTLTPKVSFYAGPGQTVSVTGSVSPTASGGALAIGSTTDAAWTPSSILISGSLGSATRVSDTRFTGVHAFQQVTLSSAGDVLIGSPRFFALIQATPASAINVNLNQPSGLTAVGSEVGKVYVATGQLSIDAPGKVVQQNSSGSASAYSGLYLLNGVSTGKTALSLDPPSVVDLFGSFVNASGVLTSGSQASRGTGLQLLGLAAGAQTPSDYRFNGCIISATAACGMTDDQEAAFELLEEQFAGVAAATTDPQALTQSVLLTVVPTLQVEEQLDPLVTGIGNEEIWRKRDGAGESDQ